MASKYSCQRSPGSSLAHVSVSNLLLHSRDIIVSLGHSIRRESRLTDGSVTQLRLANSNTGQQDLQKICGLALNFEKGAFDSASDRVRRAI